MVEYVSIISTHQARIRCLLSSLLSTDQSFKIERFQNGAILQIEINTNTISANLVYSGELDENKPEKRYYVKNEDNNQYSNFTPIKLPDIKVKNDNLFPVVNDNNYIFYLIRHGQGDHNIMDKTQKLIQRKKDTNLTKIGIQQAEKTGEFLKTNLDISNKKNLFLFASDLQRTRQTLINALKVAGINKGDINILPCSHELVYNKNGRCDGSKTQMVIAYENTSNTFPSNCNNSEACIENDDGFNINWNLYNSFYDGSRINSGKNRSRCRNTNMINEAIKFIKQKSSDAIGGRKKIKRTKRKKTKRKRQKNKKTRKYRKSKNK